SFLMRDFREFSLHLSAGGHLAGFSGFLAPVIDLDGNLDGDFVVDFWAGHIDITAGVLVEFGYLHAPDYTDDQPIHLAPIGDILIRHLHDAVYTCDGFHDFDSHFDPLG